MRHHSHLRKRLFKAGCGLLIAGAICLLLAFLRAPQIEATRAHDEMSAWIVGGVLIAFTSLLLFIFSSGRKRGLLAICALIEMYLWYGFVAWIVQIP